jgi:ABC-type Fe3+ transport system substrate-binding protein
MSNAERFARGPLIPAQAGMKSPLAGIAAGRTGSPLSRGRAGGRRWGLLCFLLLASFLLACPRVYAADDALYDAAKKEGQVVWYTSLIVNQAVRPLIAAFNKKYPGITVKYSRADSGPNAVKVMDEARAGRVVGDVFDGIATAPPLLKAGLVATFVPSEADKYPAELRDPEGRWNALIVYFLTPGINTQLVGKDDIKTARDFLDPKWQGKIAWSTSPSSGAPVYIGAVLGTMGEDKGMAFLKALAKQHIVNVAVTNRALLDQVITGQYPIALSIFNHHAVISAGKGAPVTWLKVGPIAAPMHSIGLVKNAPHPNAGKLLIDFLTSEAGQKVFADVGYLPAMPAVPGKTPDLKPEAGGFKAYFLSPATMSKNVDHWVSVYKELFY